MVDYLTNDTIADRCDKVKHVKWYLNVHVEMTRETNDGEIDNSQPYFKSMTYILLSKMTLKTMKSMRHFKNNFNLSMNTWHGVLVGH